MAACLEELTVDTQRTDRFAETHFGVADLGHRARAGCLLRVARQICRHPGGTLPNKLAHPADYDAMDRLMNRPEVTHASVLAAHVQRSKAILESTDEPVLILHDVTVLDYSGLAIAELGPVGNGHGRGYLCYNALAVDPVRREVIGLAYQKLHGRQSVPRKEGVQAKRQRPNRESRLWSMAAEALGTPAAGKQPIDVADRGADIYEFLANEIRLGRQYLVRACYNRVITTQATGGERGKLFDHLRSLPLQGRPATQSIHDPKTHEPRKAELAVAWAEVWLQPPHTRKGEYENKPIPTWAVRVWEVNPPKGATKVEWFLLSGAEVNSVGSAREKVAWYSCRYMVEEYHKAQKTGCQIEDLEFHTAQALEPMIALLSVVAVMLLNLRVAGRQPDADRRPATELVDPIYEETLRNWRYRTPRGPMTIKEYTMALGRLGGHMNRKCDGFPGWMVLWRGWTKLHQMVSGVEAERRRLRRLINRGET